MSTIIQIKRSSGTSAPSTLKLGELAYTYGTGTQGNLGDRLFIGEGGVDGNGDANNITVIGGQYFTDQLDHAQGTLTASSALLVDSNKAIDEIFIGNSSSTGGTLKLNEGTSNGTNFIGLKAPNSVTTSTTFTLPSADGSADQFIKTDGSGNLSFAAIPSGSFTIEDDSSTQDTFTTGQVLKFAGGTGLSSAVTDNTVTFNIDSTVATLTGTQTLTNKTINSASNTITITESDISDLGSYITASSSDTLTNKTIALGSNTVSGTTSQFNSALSDGSFVTLAGTETLTNKSLTSPTITGTGAIAGTFTGNITGDVTGNADTATTLATARNIGGVSFDGSANIDLPGVNTTGNQNTSGSAATLTTARTIAGQSFDGSANITIAATDLSDTNQSLATSDNVSFANLTLSGNLTVNGTTTTVASTNTTIADNLLELNSGATSNANDAGLLIERGSTGDNAIIAWDESADKFVVGTTTATSSDTGDLTIATATLVANVEGNLTGDVTGDVTGNADTATLAADATTLATPRTIAGQSFDGSANITIASTDLSDTADIALLTATQTLTNKTIAAGSNTISGLTSSHFASAVTLVINDSTGTAVKTIVGSAS